MRIYEMVVERLSEFAQQTAFVRGGAYYLNERGEVFHSSALSDSSARMLHPFDGEELLEALELLNATSGVVEDFVPEAFELIHSVPVFSASGNPEKLGEVVEIGKVMTVVEQATGNTVVMLQGIGSIAILTPVVDAEGNPNVDFVEDMYAYSSAILEMVGLLFQSEISKSKTEKDVETADN
jgi:hypothetical protein